MKLMQWCMMCVQAGGVWGLCEKRNTKIHTRVMKKSVQTIHHLIKAVQILKMFL